MSQVFLIACETTYAAMTVHKSLEVAQTDYSEQSPPPAPPTEPAQTTDLARPAEPATVAPPPALPIQPTVVPTPRDITESCGMAVRFMAADEAAARLAADAINEAKGFCALYREVQEHRSYQLVCQL